MPLLGIYSYVKIRPEGRDLHLVTLPRTAAAAIRTDLLTRWNPTRIKRVAGMPLEILVDLPGHLRDVRGQIQA